MIQYKYLIQIHILRIKNEKLFNYWVSSGSTIPSEFQNYLPSDEKEKFITDPEEDSKLISELKIQIDKDKQEIEEIKKKAYSFKQKAIKWKSQYGI